jgi:hypothetical protein
MSGFIHSTVPSPQRPLPRFQLAIVGVARTIEVGFIPFREINYSSSIVVRWTGYDEQQN